MKAILFVAAISGYDQTLFEVENRNRLLEVRFFSSWFCFFIIVFCFFAFLFLFRSFLDALS